MTTQNKDKAAADQALQQAIIDSATGKAPSEAGEKGNQEPPKKEPRNFRKDGNRPPEKKPGGLATEFRKAMGIDKDDDGGKAGGDEDPDKNKGGDDDANKNKGGQSTDDLDIQFPEIQIEGVASEAVKVKMKTFKEDRNKLKILVKERDTRLAAVQKELDDLKAKGGGQSSENIDINEHPEYKKLKEEYERQQELVEGVALADSPRFKEKYDNKVSAAMKSIQPFVLMIKDEEKRNGVFTMLERAMNVAAGEKSDPQYYEVVASVLEDSGLNVVAQNKLMTVLTGTREVINERADALNNWRVTKEQYGKEQAIGAEQHAKVIVNNFTKLRTDYESANADRIAHLRKYEIFGYDAAVKPSLAEAQVELEKSAKSGTITPQLMKFINAGVEAMFIEQQNVRVSEVLGSTLKENAALKERIKALEGQDPGEGAAPPAKKETQQTEKPKGIVGTLHNMRAAGALP